MLNSKLTYRPEIDGLRAIAVTAVIFYHAGLKVFSNGYVGVDIFFVISGYLITALILSDLQKKKFNLINFYTKRILRIIPALFIVILICMIFSWKYLLPNEMKSFSQMVFASILFISNIFLYKTDADYFGIDTKNNPFIHFWSLSVEEQYYIFFPFILIIIWKFLKNKLTLIISLFLIISLLISETEIFNDKLAKFYLLPARIWEFLVGSIVFLILKKFNKINKYNYINEILSTLGLLIILYSIFYLDKKIVPFITAHQYSIIGTSLIIIFASRNTICSKLIGNKIFILIGLISYSLYLWHQPLLVFNNIMNGHTINQKTFAVYILFLFILSYLTWKYIEQPFRNLKKVDKKYVFIIFLVLSFIFALFGITGHLNNGYPKRNELYERLQNNFGLSIKCNGNHIINSDCATSDTPEVAILGNSYAMHLIDGFKSYNTINFAQLTNTCPFNKDTVVDKRNCSKFWNEAVQTIIDSKTIRHVIISSHFNTILEEKNHIYFQEILTKLKISKKNIYIIGPTPYNGIDFAKCYLKNKNNFSNCNFDKNTVDRKFFQIVKMLDELSFKNNITFIDITNIICNENNCRSFVNNQLIYRDPGHLSREGSKYIFSIINEKKLLKFE